MDAVGIYRDDERKVPVLLKSENAAVTDAHSLENFSVWNGEHSAPLSQVTKGVETTWEWPQVRTYNRQPLHGRHVWCTAGTYDGRGTRRDTQGD